MDRLRHSGSFFAELASSPVTLGDGVLRKKRRGVIRINVAVSALKKEAKRRPIEILFHCVPHHTNEVGGVTEIIRPKYDRMTGVIHEYG